MGKMKPGDRRQRWNQSCAIGGMISVLIGLFFIATLHPITIFMGVSSIAMGIIELGGIKKGWKMSNKRPPWADRHDAINKGDLTLYKRYPSWKK